MQEDVLPIMYGAKQPVDWSKLSASLESKYQDLGREIVSFSRVFSLQQEGNWEEFVKAAVAHMQAYGSQQSPDELNSLAWAIFQNCDDPALIEQAIEWSKQSLTAGNAAYYDTYANLLYKAGKKQEAIAAQEKAVAIAKANNDDNIDDYTATLDKMKKGEKTW
jgi:tetratricopeptide (TPR) repeat protein